MSWAANVRKCLVVLCVSFACALPAIAGTLWDSKCQDHLSRLRELVPAVLADSPSPSSLSSFFEALPSDFACFDHLFGYHGGPGPLYSEPQLYLLFPGMRAAVEREAYVRKLVSLSINGQWQADQTGALRGAVHFTLETDTGLFVRLANKLPAEQEATVWWFLFSSIHPQALTPELQKKVCQGSDRSCRLSKKAYTRAEAEEHNH